MITLVTWGLVVIGLAYLITCAFVAMHVRMLIARLGTFARYWVYCPVCVSFWIGCATARMSPFHGPWWYIVPLSGLAAMGLVTLTKSVFPSDGAYLAEQGEDTPSGND